MRIDFEFPAWMIGLLLLAVSLFVRWRKQQGGSQLLFFSVFWIYLLWVVKWTVFPMYIDPIHAAAMRGHFMDNINLIPFHFGQGMTLAYAMPGIILNTLLTIPIGFGVSFITRFRPKDLSWLVAIFGAGIEGTQLLISLILGYPYRAIDVNDVIFNSLGVVLGYGLFRLSAWMYITVTRRFNIQPKGLFSHIHEVASHTVKN